MEVEDDLRNLELDRPGRGKSVEQIRKHTIDAQVENKPIERSVYLLTKGDDIQKLSVLQALPQLLQSEPQATFSRIIPKILQELPKSSCEFHVMTSKVFRILIERNLASGNLLNAVLQGIESRDLIISNTWMETLLAVINYLSEAQIKNEIIPVANSKSLLSQSTGARIASCRILGKLALHKSLKPVDVKRDVLPLAQSLCQDCHPDVRTAMCAQLPSVAQGLSGDVIIKSNLLTSLVELASDDNIYVRSAAVGAIVNMFPHLTLEDKADTILPLVKLLCEKSLKSADTTCVTVARDMGKLVAGLQASLKPNDSVWFLHCYKVLAQRGLSADAAGFRSSDASTDVVCRQHCASNLSAMAYFTFSVMPLQADLLYTVFRELAADPCYIVRGTVAGCIQEITKIFGPHSKMMKPDLVRLLRDDSEDVLLKLVPQVGNTLELLCTHGTLSRQTSNQCTMEIARALLKCQYELTNGCNWRLLTHFVHQLEHLPNCMPSDFIHQHFTPVVLTCAVQGRARPVRTQAVRTLLVFLRFNKKELQRKWLRENVVSQLCYSRCSYTRHIYIRLCLNALDIFSEKYFKEHFYDSLLDLADDPVANIRLCVASMFVALKRMLVMPDDRALDSRLERTFTRYATQETDRDAVAIFQMKMREIRSPRGAAEAEEHVLEQKRRLEEEERLTSTKSWKGPLPLVSAQKKTSGKDGDKGADNSNGGSYLDHLSDSLESKSNGATAASQQQQQQRSASVPRRSASLDFHNGDMRFLERHFYIDAGVSLPTESPGKTVVGKSRGNSRARPRFDTCHVTDDDKVDLRRLRSPAGATNSDEKRSKRHSSVLSLACLEKSDNRAASKRVLNRRSLNVPSREASKIPVVSNVDRRSFQPYSKLPLSNEGFANNANDTENGKLANDENSDPRKREGLTTECATTNTRAPKSDNNACTRTASNSGRPSHLPVLKRAAALSPAIQMI